MIAEQPRILVVDDEAQVRDLTLRALAAHGFPCDAAADGDEAFYKASTVAYEAVVTDLRMPSRHGYSLCSDLIALPDPPNVMVVTALSDPRLIRDLMSRGVYDVVQKPFDYDVLAAKVGMMLEFGKSRRMAAAPEQPARRVSQKANFLHQVESSLVELTDLCGERLDEVFDHTEDLSDPPRSVRDFIRRLAEHEAVHGVRPDAVVLPGHDARVKERVTCYTTVVAAPVDHRWAPVGEPFKLALRDLSQSGVRLLHTRATNADFLALCWNATQLVAKQIRVVCQVRRCQPRSPFYDIGGQFVMVE